MKDIITELKNEIQKWRLKLSSQIEENVRLKGFKAMVREDPKKYVNWKQRCQELENEMILIKGITVTNSPELRAEQKKVKELENRMAEVLSLEDEHQKLNGKLQMKVTELEQETTELHADNKKLAAQVEDSVNRLRKEGIL